MMIRKTVNLIAFSLILLFLFSSCGKEELKYTIPRSPVNFTVNLQGQDNKLNNLFESLYFNKPRLSGEYVGYAGLLVFTYGLDNDGLPALAAFDACCPNEGTRDAVVVADSEAKAICNKCKSVYDLTTGGRPVSGPSTERLQSYPIAKEYPYHGVFRIRN